MSAIAIIPARGGSKRIPRKNIKNFLGKPIIAYSIQAALESKIFDEVMVSTDDEEIASVARSYGATFPFYRSHKNSTDFATTFDVIEEVIDVYNKVGRTFQTGCCIYPTAPFVDPFVLDDAYRILVQNQYDTIFPIVRYNYPIWRALKVSNQKVSMIWPENIFKRSQDLTPAFHDAGQWYWFNVRALIQSKTLWTQNTYGYHIDETRAQDIDHETDWKIAEMKYRLLVENRSS